MKPSKEQFKKKWMDDFKKHDGGTQVDPSYTTSDPEGLRAGLQASFDSIFPELMKKEKHRKHVIFDDDVYKFFEEMSSDSSSNFSSLINSALRAYLKSRIAKATQTGDLLEEFLATRERERELLKEIKKQDLLGELEKKLG